MRPILREQFRRIRRNDQVIELVRMQRLKDRLRDFQISPREFGQLRGILVSASFIFPLVA